MKTNLFTLRRAVLALAGAACMAAVAIAQAAPLTFSVPLSGEQQVPSVQSPGTGKAQLTYDPDTKVVTWDISFSGLSSDVTMAHFHGPAMEGKNGPVVLWLSKKGSTSAPVHSPITGQATLSPELAQEFAAGELYVNVHTKQHPDGEVRGQVMLPKQ